MTFYVWKIKVTWENYVVRRYMWGCTYIPAYNQFEFNFGRRCLNFWYRKDIIR